MRFYYFFGKYVSFDNKIIKPFKKEMAEHILNMVRLANPEAIEKYVKYHLPNDQASL